MFPTSFSQSQTFGPYKLQQPLLPIYHQVYKNKCSDNIWSAFCCVEGTWTFLKKYFRWKYVRLRRLSDDMLTAWLEPCKDLNHGEVKLDCWLTKELVRSVRDRREHCQDLFAIAFTEGDYVFCLHIYKHNSDMSLWRWAVWRSKSDAFGERGVGKISQLYVDRYKFLHQQSEFTC